jgi:hypothetical protein
MSGKYREQAWATGVATSHGKIENVARALLTKLQVACVRLLQ